MLNSSWQPRFGGPTLLSEDGTAPWSAGRRTALSGGAGEPLECLMVGRTGSLFECGCATALERVRTETTSTSCQINHLIPPNPAPQAAWAAVAVIIAPVTVPRNVLPQVRVGITM